MNLTDIKRISNNFGSGGEKLVMGALWRDTEADLMTALRRVIYCHQAQRLAQDLEEALAEEQMTLARLEAARDEAVAEADALRADYDRARSELSRMGRGTRQAEQLEATGRLHEAARGLEVANREATNAIGQHRACQQRVTGMGRLLHDLRHVEPPDPEVLRCLAEALNGAG